jgi:tetratricopeptide (TPR) repeat protein
MSNNFIYGICKSEESIIRARTILYEAIQTFDQKKMIEAESLFERILSADSKIWIAHYYIALADENISHTFYSNNKKREQYVNKGIEHLESCIKLKKDFSEAYILLAGLYGIKIGFDRFSVISLHSKISAALNKAKKLEPDNPRLYLVRGRSSFYTPEIYGGGIKKARNEFNKALELFPKYKIEKEIYPDWGHDEVYSYLGQIAVQEEQFEQARFYYSKSLEINNNNSYVKYKLIPLLEKAMTVNVPVITPGGGFFLETNSVTVKMGHDKYQIYYTLDGSEPTVTSKKWENIPLVINKNTVIKARAIATDKRQSGIVTTQFETAKLWPSANFEDGIKKGLKYSYYEGEWSTLPDFDTLKILERGVTAKISLERKKRNDYFGFLFSGFIDIAQAGEYVFYLQSDDGSRLNIDDEDIINNDGLHNAHVEKSYQIPLDKGKHTIKLSYFQHKNDKQIKISYSGHGIEKQELSEDILFYK